MYRLIFQMIINDMSYKEVLLMFLCYFVIEIQVRDELLAARRQRPASVYGPTGLQRPLYP